MSADSFGVLRAAERARQGPAVGARLLGGLVELGVAGLAALPFVAPLALPLLLLLGLPPAPVLLATALVWAWWGGFWVDQLRLRGRPAPPRPRLARPPGSVIIIGAGPAGLAALKECLEQGLSAICLEQHPGIGGVFRFDEGTESGVWDSVRFTSSAAVTAFSALAPEEPLVHHTHDQYLRYLERYVRAFSLGPHLRLGHKVVGVRALPEGGWALEVEAEGHRSELRADRLAVCTGLHQRPQTPELPGFTGELLHVARYKHAEAYAGKRVAVVGMGESAVDIALDLVGVAAEVSLSARRGSFVIPRINPLTGLPNDLDTNRLRYATPQGLRDAYARLRRWTCAMTGEHGPASAARAALLEASEAGPFSQPSTKSGGFIQAILEGRVTLRREPVSAEGKRVRFADGGEAELDLLLYATGFEPRALTPEGLEALHPGALYLRMFHPEGGDRVAWLGFARPAIGAIPPVAELQARLFALVASGQRALPSPEEMRGAVARANAEHARRFPTRPPPSAIIEWLPYMDSLADAIGCRPEPWRLLRDPRLLWKLMTGPVSALHYRLHGEGAAQDARERALGLPRGHGLGELLTLLGLHVLAWPLSKISGDPRARSGDGVV